MRVEGTFSSPWGDAGFRCRYSLHITAQIRESKHLKNLRSRITSALMYEFEEVVYESGIVIITPRLFA